MINIDGIEYRTAAQWEKKHRHVLKGQLKKGVERSWRSPNGNETMMFYSVEQTRPWAKKDVEAVNRRRRADAKAKRDAEECERIEGAARAEQHRKDLLDCWGAHIDEETLQEGRRDHTANETGRVKNPPRFVSGVDPPTCESCRPCFGGQHRQQG